MDEENLEMKLFLIPSPEKAENREKWWVHYSGKVERENRDYIQNFEESNNHEKRSYHTEIYIVENHEITVAYEKSKVRIYYH